MRRVDVEIGGERYRDVAVPTRFVERWRGLRASSGPMLFRANSVHGFGMKRSLTVVALSGDRRVVAVRTLRSRSVVYERGAVWMLELETDRVSPSVGDLATTYDPAHDRETRGVRHSDRQSR